MRSVWLVRHGERIDNVNSNWAESAPRGAWDDPTLSSRGHFQSHEVGLRLINEPIDYVFCSPFTRAIESTNDIVEVLETNTYNAPSIFVEPGFCKSLHSCQPVPGYLDSKQMKKQFPRVDINYKPYWSSYYTETTSICCRRRIKDTIQKVLRDYPGNILIVGHGTTIAALHYALSGQSIYVGQCTISHYIVHEESDQEGEEKLHFEAVLVGNTEHLSDPTNLYDYPMNWKI